MSVLLTPLVVQGVTVVAAAVAASCTAGDILLNLWSIVPAGVTNVQYLSILLQLNASGQVGATTNSSLPHFTRKAKAMHPKGCALVPLQKAGWLPRGAAAHCRFMRHK